MAKRNLSALLGTSIAEAPPAGDVSPAGRVTLSGPAATPKPSDTHQSKPPAGAAGRTIRRTQPRAGGATGPRYLELDRKELRIRGDQTDELTALTRQLNRARKSEGERITDNTLIRVAIDVLMRDRDKLRGTTEAEILRSILPD